MHKITAREIINYCPCASYSSQRVKHLIGEGKTLKEFLSLDIPEEDRVWTACMYLRKHNKHLLDCWLGDIRERAIRIHALNCDVAKVEQWAQDWLDGVKNAHIGIRVHNSESEMIAHYDDALNAEAAICVIESVYQRGYEAIGAVMEATHEANASEEKEAKWQIESLLSMLD